MNQQLAIVPASSEDPFPTVWGPLRRLLAGIESLDLKGQLARLDPKRLAGAVLQGVGDLAREQDAMTPGTVKRLRSWGDSAIARVKEHQAVWAHLDDYARNGTWRSFQAGMKSDETELGSIIGGLFGDLGSIIGAMIGGAAAGQRIAEEAKAAWETLVNGLLQWDQVISFEFNQTIAPLIRADRARPAPVRASSSKAWWLVVAAVLISVCVVGYVAARKYLADPPAAPRSTAEAPLSVAAPIVDPWMDALLGYWLSPDHERYLVSRGGDVARAEIADDVRGFDAHASAFSFERTETEGVYLVSQVLRPALGKGEWFEVGANSSCEVIVRALADRPLKARLVDGILRVETLRVRPSKKLVVKKGKAVTRCQGLEDAPTTMFELVLTRPEER